MTDREYIIYIIKKLYALSGNNPERIEADSARNKARYLIRKYGLYVENENEDYIDICEIKENEELKPCYEKRYTWRNDPLIQELIHDPETLFKLYYMINHPKTIQKLFEIITEAMEKYWDYGMYMEDDKKENL